MKIRVYHSYYGCDTGCCGHIVEVDGEEIGRFSFGHAHSDKKAWARKLVEEQLAGNHCLETIDWDSIDISDVQDGMSC